MISIIIPVLNSHAMFQRHMDYYQKILKGEEIIVVDDGSDPPLEHPFPSILRTNDIRPWTQPRAKNIGAAASSGDYLMFIDIDHLPVHLCAAREYVGRWAKFYRYRGIWDNGLKLGAELNVAPGLFLVKQECFTGFNESRLGEYWAEDIDFQNRMKAKWGSPDVIPELVAFKGETHNLKR